MPGWSPSNVRSRIVISIGLRFVDIDEAGLRQRLAHLVHIEPEHAGGEYLALALLLRLALLTLGGDFGGILPADNDNAIIIGDDDITGMNMARSAKYKNVQSNPNVAFVADDMPAPERGAGGVRFLEIRGIAETVAVPPGPGQPETDGHLAPEIIRIRPRRIIAYNVDPENLGLQTRDIGADVAR